VADITRFDPRTIADMADFAAPHRYATGVEHVLVRGRQVVKAGTLTGDTPGRVLRKPL
jgi:N-acyl-D-amino-acid deacylase